MAKDIVISGSTFLGVEQIKIQTPNGGEVAFVDADTKNPQAIICGFSCKLNDKISFVLKSVTAKMAMPQTTNTYILEE